jgi:hypothetical protein
MQYVFLWEFAFNNHFGTQYVVLWSIQIYPWILIGLCILLRVYQSISIETSVRTTFEISYYKPPEDGHQ